MGATTVSGTILGVDNAPRVGVYVYFRLKTTGTDSVATSTIDATRISATTDANGQFSTTLWDNGDSGVTSIMEIQMPSGQRHDVIIPAGDAAIDIWDLIETYTVGTADPQLPTNQALFMRKANNLSDVVSASTSRTNLGVAIGSDVQAHSAVLDATTASFTIADETKLDSAYSVGGTDVAIADGGTGASTASAARTNLGLVIGTNVQAYDAQLADLAGLTPTNESIIKGNGTNFVTATNFRVDAGTAGSGVEMGTGVANGSNAVAEGNLTTASGSNSHAEGTSTTASGTSSHAEGFGTTASGLYSHAEGLSTTASGFYSSATGRQAKAIHNGARVEADGQAADVSSTTTNQFTARFQNGYVLKGGALTLDTDLAVTEGGTGASTASAARTNLGFAPNAAPSTTTVTTTTYTALVTDSVILADDDTAAAIVTITLPAAATAGNGFIISIKKMGNTADVIIDGNASETIDGALTNTITLYHDWRNLVSDGSNWHIIG